MDKINKTISIEKRNCPSNETWNILNLKDKRNEKKQAKEPDEKELAR